MAGCEVGGDGVRLDNRGSRRGEKRPHNVCHNPREDLAHDHGDEVVHPRVLLRWGASRSPDVREQSIRASGAPAYGAASMGRASVKVTNKFLNKPDFMDYKD